MASTLAGTFAVRTELARRAGGYLDGLGTRHQTELFLRLLALAGPAGLRVASVPDLLIHIEARVATDRPGVNPRRLYDGTRWIMARHPTSFPPGSRVTGLFEGVVGTNAARLGDWRAARRHLRRAVRATPRSREAWGRLGLASVPLLGRQVWNRLGDWATHDAAELGVLRQPPRGPDAGADVGERELFLPWRYQQNQPAPVDGPAAAPGDATTAARRLARRLAARHRWGPLVEVGAADSAGANGGSPRPRGQRLGRRRAARGVRRRPPPGRRPGGAAAPARRRGR